MSNIHSDLPQRRIPVRLHRGVGLILTDDDYLATELLTSPKLAPYIAGRLTRHALLIAQDAAPALIKALKQNGYPVRVVSRLLGITSPPSQSAPAENLSAADPSASSGYITSDRQASLKAISLSTKLDAAALLPHVATESINRVWKNWCGQENYFVPPSNPQAALDDLLKLWQDPRFLRTWIQRHYRRNPRFVWRLALLRLFRHSVLPRPLLETLLSGALKASSQDKTSALSPASLFLDLCPGSQDRLAGSVYIPPMLVEAAWKKLIKPTEASRPFPSRYVETDGLDAWIGLCLVWQAGWDSPLRFTGDGTLHKRDAERLRELLNKLPKPPIGQIPPPESWWQLACVLGWFSNEPEQRVSKPQHLAAILNRSWLDLATDFWHAWLMAYLSPLPIARLTHQSNPMTACPDRDGALFLCVLVATASLLALPEQQGLALETIQQIVHQHPALHLNGDVDSVVSLQSCQQILEEWLGVLWMLGLVHWSEEHQLIRLSPLGRRVFGLESQWHEPEEQPCLVVQPNLEVVAFRPALRPTALVMLSQLAQWKATHPALVLQIDSSSIHRALQSGYTAGEILAWIEQQNTRAMPEAVRSLITTWAQQQQRIAVYPQATLLEFDTPQDLHDSCRERLLGVVLSERLFLLDEGADLDFRQFRITANIHYLQPLHPSVKVLEDGITLEVKLNQANLLLECELQQLADLVETDSIAQIRRYRITPESVARSRQQGWSVLRWQQWFLKRCGRSPSPAIHFLLTVSHAELFFGPLYVLETPSETLADGLMQWSETSSFIIRRLGPTALAVRAESKDAFVSLLRNLGAQLRTDADTSSPASAPSGSPGLS